MGRIYMAFNKALIPLYMNTDMLSNLFSVAVQEYIEIKSFSNKDTVTVHFKTPISEFSWDIFGKYIQGDMDVQIQNEITKQKTEENVSASIVVLKRLKDLLIAQKLLKNIHSTEVYDAMEENDYVEFNCKLNKNPTIANIENSISMLEMDDFMGNAPAMQGEESEANKEFNSRQMKNYLKSSLEDFKGNHCVRYLGNSIENLDRRCILPLKTSCFIDNEDYLFNGSIRVFGKVINKFDNKQENDFNPLLNNCILDYIDCSEIENLNFPYLKQRPTIQTTGLESSLTYPMYEILPIVMYI